MIAILLTAALVVYNNLANRFPAFHGWAYVPLNLLVTGCALVIALASGQPQVTLESVGITPEAAAFGVTAGAAAGLVPVALLAAMLSTPAGVRWLADPRLRKDHKLGTTYFVLVHIPLGTALTEEVIFRGILPALFRPHGAVTAAVVSSLAFGLWHIMPALNRLLIANPEASTGRRLLVVVTTVALTTLAGMFLAGIRATTNLGVTFGLHAAINSGAALVGLEAHRRIRSDSARR